MLNIPEGATDIIITEGTLEPAKATRLVSIRLQLPLGSTSVKSIWHNLERVNAVQPDHDI